MPETILIVEDNELMQKALGMYLTEAGYGVEYCADGESALKAIKEQTYPVILIDLGLPDIEGLELIEKIKADHHKSQLIVVTGQSHPDVIKKAGDIGASDYLVKPPRRERIVTTVKNAIERFKLQEEVSSYQEKSSRHKSLRILGDSDALLDVFNLIEVASSSMAPVLMSGAAGTGKESAALALHNIAYPDSRKVITLDCAATEKNRQAAKFKARIAKIHKEEGNGQYTIIITHLAKMDPDLQKSLAADIRRGDDLFGSDIFDKTDNMARLIATINTTDPVQAVKDKRIAKELFTALNVFSINLPPLKDRPSDIEFLAERFLNRRAQTTQKNFSAIHKDALDILTAYQWPGNIRELDDVIKSIVDTFDSETVTADMIPAHIKAGNEEDISAQDKIRKIKLNLFSDMSPESIIPVATLEKLAIEHAIEACGGDMKQAAKHLKIGLATLYRKRPAQ